MSDLITAQFNKVLTQIQQAKQKAYQQINTALIELYWNVGQYISEQVKNNQWGKGIVADLADFIARQDTEIKGFSARNLWRMKQFYETYQEHQKLSTLWTQYENPSIGVLLCREKNDEVVEYALSRSLSPAVIAEYETKLIPKEVLRKKLNEFYEHLEAQGDE